MIARVRRLMTLKEGEYGHSSQRNKVSLNDKNSADVPSVRIMPDVPRTRMA